MSSSFDLDRELAAGALRGEPNQLAALARRLELVPRLVAAWNTHLEPALDAEEQVDLACEATISLWQDLPQYAEGESLDSWLAIRCADLLGVDDHELSTQVLGEAQAMDQALGQVQARDALARFRADQITTPSQTSSASRKGNPLWAVLGVLGVIATFLAISPSSPLRQGRDSPPSLVRPVAIPELRLIEPLSSVQTPKRFRWSAPAGEPCTIVVEGADGQAWIRARGITSGRFETQEPAPDGPLRWQVIADSPSSKLRPTPWEVLSRD